VANYAHHKITQITKVGLGHGMIPSLQIIQVLQTHTSKTAKTGTVNLVAEHFGVVTMCSPTKFTVPILAVFHM